MEEIAEIVRKLNNDLTVADLNITEFLKYIELLAEKFKIKVRILDFEYFNKDRMEKINNEKLAAVRERNFEWAAICREEEKIIIKYIEQRIEDKIEKSGFYFENGNLFYYHLGTRKNDKVILEELERYQ